MSEKLHVGKHYFFRQSRRVDQFRHKRYTTPELEQWEVAVMMGEVVKQHGDEVKVVIRRSQMQKPDPLDGDFIVFGAGQALCMPGGDLRVFEEHGLPDCTIGCWERK